MNSNIETRILYHELNSWWQLFSPPADYEAEAKNYKKIFLAYSSSPPTTVLELGSGGGNNASFLKHDFQMTLVDISLDMLEISRQLNPECEHIQGDMRTLRLDQVFDIIFIHDAIMYITTKEDLLKVMKTAFAHCRPGGIALLTPDYVKETFKPSTDHGGINGNGKGIRYLEWTFDPEPDDTSYIVEFAMLLHESEKTTQIKYDRHILGLFKRDEWLQSLEEVGFESRNITDLDGHDLFIGIKPK